MIKTIQKLPTIAVNSIKILRLLNKIYQQISSDLWVRPVYPQKPSSCVSVSAAFKHAMRILDCISESRSLSNPCITRRVGGTKAGSGCIGCSSGGKDEENRNPNTTGAGREQWRLWRLKRWVFLVVFNVVFVLQHGGCADCAWVRVSFRERKWCNIGDGAIIAGVLHYVQNNKDKVRIERHKPF